MFIRFELAFNGMPQDVGIFTGLDDIGSLDETNITEILTEFDELPIPSLSQLTNHCQFWFTEKGLCRFKRPINKLINTLTDCNWQIIVKEIEEINKKDIVYEDTYQIALDTSTLDLKIKERMLEI